jgi:heptosyltransferase-1
MVIRLAESIGSGARDIDHFPLKGLIALLRKVDLVVGGDCGPVHIAASVGTPTVSLYRATDVKRSGPRGPQHAVIRAPMECSGCYRTICDRDRECRESITAEMVMKGIEKVLGKGEGDGVQAG